MTATIRPYRPADRAAILQIAADTAFFGRPVEAFLPDRRFMQDIFVSYYVDCEGDHTWVAEVDGVVAGYINGSIGADGMTRRRARCAVCKGRLYAAVLGKVLTGYYRLGRDGWAHIARTVGAALRGEYPRADLRPYPAHLHINVTEGHRGLGLGRQLMQSCLRQMSGLGVAGIHLNTTSLNSGAVVLYEKMGFQLLASRRSYLWESLLPGTEVHNLLYGRRITEEALREAPPTGQSATLDG
jgi:GNAT superfamily N-acetyltransferase